MNTLSRRLLLDLDESEVHFRRNLIRSISIWSGGVILIGIPIRHFFFSTKFWYLPFNLIEIAIFATIPWLLKKKGNESLSGYLLLGNFTLLGTSSAFLNAGVRAPSAIAFILLPLLGMLCCGKRGGFVGLALTLVLVPALVFAENSGWVLPQDSGLPGYLAAILCIAAAVSYSIAIAYENSRKRSEQLLLEISQSLAASSKLGALGEMAAGIAHEINNPLSVVLGKAYQSRAQIEDGDLNQITLLSNLDKIADSSKRIAKIIRGLRTLSRGAENDPLEPVTIDEILEDALSICLERFKSHGIDLQMGASAEGKIMCRKVQISQVLINLLNNAFDALEHNADKWIRIDSRRLPHEKMEISVTDAGRGISSPIAEKMMHPFFTTKDPGKGTGLGLSISKVLIEQHGGRFFYDAGSHHTRFVIEFSHII